MNIRKNDDKKSNSILYRYTYKFIYFFYLVMYNIKGIDHNGKYIISGCHTDSRQRFFFNMVHRAAFLFLFFPTNTNSKLYLIIRYVLKFVNRLKMLKKKRAERDVDFHFIVMLQPGISLFTNKERDCTGCVS